MDIHSFILLTAAVGIVFLLVLNGITCLLGVGFIYVGVRLKQEVEKHEDVMELLDKVDLGGITLREIVDLLIKIVIVIGVFAVVTSLIGGCGAICKVRVLLILYVGIIITCIIIELTVLGYWIKLLKGVHEFLFGEFNRLLKKYEGPTAVDLITIGWNAVFIFFTCCGVKPVTLSYNDFQSLPAEWWLNVTRGSDVIPSSCCEDVSIDNYMNYTNTACTQSLIGYHKAGCYDAFDDILSTLASTAISITSVIVLIEAAAIFFSVVIVYVETRRKKTAVVI